MKTCSLIKLFIVALLLINVRPCEANEFNLAAKLDEFSQSYLLLEYGDLRKAALDNVPGRLAVKYKEANGRIIVRLLALSCLKTNVVKPSVVVDPLVYLNESFKKEIGVNANYVGFLGFNFSKEEMHKLTIERTVSVGVSPEQIDWTTYDLEVARILKKYTNGAPQEMEFFVIEIASLISAGHSVFKGKNFSASGEGYGIKADGKFYEQIGNEQNKILLAVTPSWKDPFRNPSVASFFSPTALDLTPEKIANTQDEHERAFYESLLKASSEKLTRDFLSSVGNNKLNMIEKDDDSFFPGLPGETFSVSTDGF